MRGSPWATLAMGTIGLAGGCGGGSPARGTAAASLDCAVLTGDNCWKTTAISATGCLPPPSALGTLSADGKTCSYPSGEGVAFAQPLVLPLPTTGAITWSFSVTSANGAPCLAYQADGKGGVTLTVQGQTVSESALSEGGLLLTCPDGTRYSTSTELSALDCSDAGLLDWLPTGGWSVTGSIVGFYLVDAQPNAAYVGVPVFACQATASP